MSLELYNKVRSVPLEAQKQILGGRLKGMTDINPMWRIKRLTEEFGICGIGWKIELINKWIEDGAENERACFVEIMLYIKSEGEWSDGILGIGGSSFISKESRGLYTSDECFKMALTDAISVACKMLGFGADIYWQKDRSKYDIKKSEDVEDKINADLAKIKTLAGLEEYFNNNKDKQKDNKAFNRLVTRRKSEL